MNDEDVRQYDVRNYEQYMLRAGRHVSRTLYLVHADEPDGDGILVGVVDSADLAAKIVRLWNEDFLGTQPVPAHMREYD